MAVAEATGAGLADGSAPAGPVQAERARAAAVTRRMVMRARVIAMSVGCWLTQTPGCWTGWTLGASQSNQTHREVRRFSTGLVGNGLKAVAALDSGRKISRVLAQEHRAGAPLASTGVV